MQRGECLARDAILSPKPSGEPQAVKSRAQFIRTYSTMSLRGVRTRGRERSDGLIGYQGVETKLLVINGVEKEDYVGMCQSSLEEFFCF